LLIAFYGSKSLNFVCFNSSETGK